MMNVLNRLKSGCNGRFVPYSSRVDARKTLPPLGTTLAAPVALNGLSPHSREVSVARQARAAPKWF